MVRAKGFSTAGAGTGIFDGNYADDAQPRASTLQRPEKILSHSMVNTGIKEERGFHFSSHQETSAFCLSFSVKRGMF